MKVTRTSKMTGVTHTLELDVTQEQLDRHANREGLAQDIFPNLLPHEREFIISGTTDEEWKAMFGE